MYNIRIINSIIQLVNIINYQLHICASIALTICKYFYAYSVLIWCMTIKDNITPTFTAQ